MKTLKEKLLKALPKKYHDRVLNIESAEGLISDCKYIIKWTDEYTDGECAGSSYPVRSIKEAAEFYRDSLYKV